MPLQRWSAVLALATAGAVWAQAPARPAASAAGFLIPYRSAFDGYRRHADEPLADWRAANDTVGRIGGWKAYAREAAGAASAASAPAPSPASSAAGSAAPASPAPAPAAAASPASTPAAGRPPAASGHAGHAGHGAPR